MSRCHLTSACAALISPFCFQDCSNARSGDGAVVVTARVDGLRRGGTPFRYCGRGAPCRIPAFCGLREERASREGVSRGTRFRTGRSCDARCIVDGFRTGLPYDAVPVRLLAGALYVSAFRGFVCEAGSLCGILSTSPGRRRARVWSLEYDSFMGNVCAPFSALRFCNASVALPEYPLVYLPQSSAITDITAVRVAAVNTMRFSDQPHFSK